MFTAEQADWHHIYKALGIWLPPLLPGKRITGCMPTGNGTGTQAGDGNIGLSIQDRIPG